MFIPSLKHKCWTVINVTCLYCMHQLHCNIFYYDNLTKENHTLYETKIILLSVCLWFLPFIALVLIFICSGIFLQSVFVFRNIFKQRRSVTKDMAYFYFVCSFIYYIKNAFSYCMWNIWTHNIKKINKTSFKQFPPQSLQNGKVTCSKSKQSSVIIDT